MADDESFPILLSPIDVLERYLLELDPESLQSACRSCREFADICRDDDFWKLKLKKDFGENIKKEDTWKKTWISHVTLPKIEFNFIFSTYRLDKYADHDSNWYENFTNHDITDTERNYLLKYFVKLIEHSKILNGEFNLDEIVINGNDILFIFTFSHYFLNYAGRYFDPKNVLQELIHFLSKPYNSFYGALPLDEGDVFNAIALKTNDSSIKIKSNREVKSYTSRTRPENFYF